MRLWSIFVLSLLCSAGQAAARTVLVLDIDGAIGAATAAYVEQGLDQGQEREAEAVVLRMDTPGGLDSAMRTIVKAILASPVPVIGYVAPPGARAASAGTYILYATHVAAMAPSTTLGAATPVQIGGLPGKGPAGKGEDKEGPEEGGDAMTRKLVNDAVAFIRGLAQQRGRNADWAEQAVREAATLTAEEALKLGVVDVVAEDLGALLDAVEGRTVETFAGTRTLATAGAQVERLAPDWRIRLLSVITDPTVAYVLLLVGIYGLIFELSSPGAVLPGVVGLISLLLALYAFQVLPINYAGLALMLVGVAFMVAEAFVPSFGALGLGGVLAFVAGSLILLEEDQLAISLPVIGGTALVSAGFFVWVLTRFVRLRRERAHTGREELIGLEGEALEPLDPEGYVQVRGERWRARSSCPLPKGARVRVRAVHGLRLEVEAVREPEIKEVCP